MAGPATWDQVAVAPLCPTRTAWTMVPVAASTAVTASTRAAHFGARGAVALSSFQFHHNKTAATTTQRARRSLP